MVVDKQYFSFQMEKLLFIFQALYYHLLKQIPEVLPLQTDLCCCLLVFPVLAGVVVLHELADVFPHDVVVQSARKFLLLGNKYIEVRCFTKTGWEEQKKGKRRLACPCVT